MGLDRVSRKPPLVWPIKVNGLSGLLVGSPGGESQFVGRLWISLEIANCFLLGTPSAHHMELGGYAGSQPLHAGVGISIVNYGNFKVL